MLARNHHAEPPMPELPEVETVRRGLAPAMEGARFVKIEQRRPDLRFPFPKDFARRLKGREVEKLERRAKYLLASLDDGEVLAMHLGMSGRFVIEKGKETIVPGEFVHDVGRETKHEHVVFTMSNGAVIRYTDARRFGYMTLIEPGGLAAHPLFKGLGVEPLDGALTPNFLARRAAGRSQSLKAFLLDQRVIAGLGNIYVCEALFRARLSPFRPASVLATQSGAPAAGARKLAEAIPAVLKDAIAAGGSSLRDYRQADGSPGYFQHTFAVYGREGEPCPGKGCRGAIERVVQNGRSTFYCPSCQK